MEDHKPIQAHSKLLLTPLMRLQSHQLHKQKAGRTQKKTDWNELKRQMERVAETEQSTENIEAILQERANNLAHPIISNFTETNQANLVVLRLQQCQIALEVDYVSKIIPLENITIVPGLPGFIVGLINAHGKILTVISLDEFLRQAPGQAGNNTASQKQTVVVIALQNFEFGLLCEDFPIFGQHPLQSFHPLQEIRLDYRVEFLKGINEDGILLLDLPALITSSDFLINQD